MKKIYVVTLMIIFLFTTSCLYATEQIALPQTSPEVIRNSLLSETQIHITSSGDDDTNESGSSMVGEVEDSKVENKNSVLSFLWTLIELGIIVYLASKTFQYIKEFGKTSSEIKNEEIKYEKELPFDDITPGQAEFLKDVNLANEGNIFAASLLNMKIKGAIKFGYVGNEKLYENAVIKLVKEDETQLLAEEKTIYDFLTAYERKFSKEDGTISLYMLQKYMENNKDRIGKLKKFIEESTKQSIISYDIEADKRVKKRAVDSIIYFLVFIIMLMIHAGAFQIFSIYTWIYFIAIINIILCLGIVFKTKIFGKEGAENREKLKGFERYLKDFATVDAESLPDIELWEYYIVFAMAFGIAPSVLKQIKDSYPNLSNSNFIETYEHCEYILKCDFKSKFLFSK